LSVPLADRISAAGFGRRNVPTLASERFNDLHEALKIFHYLFILNEVKRKFRQSK
jgi:hypothetical protein